MYKGQKEARAAGKVRFSTGKACPNGHLAERYSSSGKCVVCDKEQQAKDYADGKRVKTKESVAKSSKKWNSSEKGKSVRQQWKEKNPKRAWAATAKSSAKIRAKKKGVEFDLTIDYIESILTDTCPVFGTPFRYIGSEKMNSESPTIDRIRPEEGYVEGNVIVISLKANCIKYTATSEEIQKVADWLRVLESR